MRMRGELERGTGGLARCRREWALWAVGSALLLALVGAGCRTQGRGVTPVAGSSAPSAKISPRLTAQRGAQGVVLAVLIRTEGPLSGQQRRQLRAAGVAVDGVSGDIVSGRVATRCLERLCALPFVRYIEPGSRLGPAREERR